MCALLLGLLDTIAVSLFVLVVIRMAKGRIEEIVRNGEKSRHG